MQTDDKQHRSILQNIAHRAMLQRGLLPDFSAEAFVELGRIQAPAEINGKKLYDLGACYGRLSVYTADRIFPMLPEKLSTDLTSLNFNEDRDVSLRAFLAQSSIAI